MQNFVSERMGIAIQANRFARVCLEQSIERTSRRTAFGKKLIQQPVVSPLSLVAPHHCAE
jgi:alkylation response protein AidB-like acyl-CoA dehydrogenase